MERIATQVSPELTKQQLQQLLEKNEFKRSPILTRFLEFVVMTKLSGKEDEIKEYTIGLNALGRAADFNPQLDAIVRIHASRLRNVLVQYYQSDGKNDPIIISIPKGTYVPRFEPNGTEKVENLTPVIQNNSNEAVYEKTLPLQNKKSSLPVLAILPFHDLSPEKSSDDFLTALGEQLSTELARFDNLSIISFYVTQNLHESVDYLKDLKREGINYVITGSLRLLNGTIRLNIQLMNIEDGSILWSSSFLRHELTDQNCVDIQDELVCQIANAVADDPSIRRSMNKTWQWPDMNAQDLTQEAITQYFDYTYDYNSKKFATTLSVMEHAYEKAGENALIVAILAKLYLDQYACAIEHDNTVFEKGMELAKKAVWLDSRSTHAQKALAWAHILSGNKRNGEEAIDRCIAVNPSAANSLSTMGLGLIMLGDYEKGCSMLHRSLKFQQTPSACAKLGFSLYYYQNKNYQESSKWLTLLSPFDVPFSRLLHIAVAGHLCGELETAESLVPTVKGFEIDIVDRIALTPALRTNIIDGWKLAGFMR